MMAILRLAPFGLLGAALILAAGFGHGWVQWVLWLAAVVIGLFGPLLARTRGWRVEPAHFIERHGLIIIIAIGESLVAIGIGARGVGLGPAVIVGAVLGLVVAASFWLAYFDFFPIRARQLLVDRSGTQRTALARDVFTYLHLPMVAGIILFAFAMKETLAHVDDNLSALPALCLCGGPALYLAAYVALRLRVSAGLGRGREGDVVCGLLAAAAGRDGGHVGSGLRPSSGRAVAGVVCSAVALIIAIDLSVHVGTWAARNTSCIRQVRQVHRPGGQ